MTVNTYLATSKEFQPIRVTNTLASVTKFVTSAVQYVVVPKGTSLSEGTPTTPASLGGEIGFFTDSLTTGYWEVGVRVIDNPEQPFISCGFIRIK